jgi:aquaporin Z
MGTFHQNECLSVRPVCNRFRTHGDDFCGGHISGGHFNPAVTLGVWLRGKCEAKDVAPYTIFQIMGAVLVALVVNFLKGGAAVAPLQPATVPALLAEFLFTFVLV